MSKKFSEVLSYVFQPLLMPTLVFGILYFFLPEVIRPMSLIVLPFLFITTFIIPVISITMLKVLGTIKSFMMKDRKDRVIPFLYVTLFYAVTTYMFIFKVHVNEIVSTIFLSTCALLFLLTIITTRFKISIHSAGMMGSTGYLMALAILYPESSIFYAMIGMLLLSGIVMSSRLHLNAHRPIEVLTGALLGMTLCFTSLYIIAS